MSWLLVLLAATALATADPIPDAAAAAVKYPDDFNICFTGCSMDILFCMDYFCKGTQNTPACIASCHDFFLVDTARCVCGCKPYVDSFVPTAPAARLLADGFHGGAGAVGAAAGANATGVACVQKAHSEMNACTKKCAAGDLACDRACLSTGVDGFCTCAPPPPAPTPAPTSGAQGVGIASLPVLVSLILSVFWSSA